MKADLHNLEAKNFKERPRCRRIITQLLKTYNCTLFELAEDHNFFKGAARQLQKMILEQRRNRR